MRTILVSTFGAMLTASLIAAAPLSLLTAWAGLDRFGLAAAEASGSVWDGRLRAATLHGMRLGDVALAAEPGPLFKGETRVLAEANGGAVAGRVVLIKTGGSSGFSDAVGEAPLSLLGGPGKVQGRLQFEDLSARFEGRRCRTASGRMSAEVQGLASIPGTLRFAGGARCDGDAVMIPLRGRAGEAQVELQLRVAPDGRYRTLTRVVSADPAIMAGLRLAGFVDTGAGQARTEEGRLWR